MTQDEKQIVLSTLREMLNCKDDTWYTGHGLCSWMRRMFYNSESSTSIASHLTDEYIDNNRPVWYSLDSVLYFSGRPGYYWRPGAVAPRVRWIKKHIKLLSKSIDNE